MHSRHSQHFFGKVNDLFLGRPLLWRHPVLLVIVLLLLTSLRIHFSAGARQIECKQEVLLVSLLVVFCHLPQASFLGQLLRPFRDPLVGQLHFGVRRAVSDVE